MIDATVADPNQSLLSNRFDDIEQPVHDDQPSLKRSFRRLLNKKRIVLIVGILSSVVLLIGIVLTGVYVSRDQYTKKFRSNLQNHLKVNFPAIDSKLTEAYVKELGDMYYGRHISYDHVKEFDALSSFEKFSAEYKKVHANDNERKEKFLIFRKNYFDSLTHKGHETYTKSINFFSDLTDKEFNNLFPQINVPKNESPSDDLQLHMNKKGVDSKFLELLTLAKGSSNAYSSLEGVEGNDIDWRRTDGVTKVKDQGMCGSCWAFAAIGSVESSYKIHKGQTLDLSEQELVNCEPRSHGCEGGFGDTALEYIKEKGISSSADIPYHAVNQTCEVKSKDKVFIGSFTIANGLDILNKSLVISPTIVYIGVTSELTMYKSGVYNGSCAKGLNHAVLLVGEGYDEVLDKRFWIIKNSWGPHWGENGYIRLERTDKGTDKCGVLDTGITPLL